MLTHSPMTAETLATLLGQGADCMLLVEPGGRVVWLNGAALRALEGPGQPWPALWAAADQPMAAAALDRAAAGEPAQFDAARPGADGTQRWWSVTLSAVRGVNGLPAGCLCVARDETGRRAEAEARRMLTSQLRHRLRNSYAVVSGMLMSFARNEPPLEAFAEEMAERIMGLATAQSLFDREGAAADLQRLIDALVRPFDGPNCPISLAEGPPAPLSGETADAIALVVGELLVNAGRDGALAHGGEIDIEAMQDESGIRILWHERSEAPIKPRRREGGEGLDLIALVVAARQGSFHTEWDSHGLTATLSIA